MTSPFVYFSFGKKTLSRFETLRFFPLPKSREPSPPFSWIAVSCAWIDAESGFSCAEPGLTVRRGVLDRVVFFAVLARAGTLGRTFRFSILPARADVF